jgi:hypothetical protein
MARTSNLPRDQGADRLGPSNPVSAVLLGPPERLSEIAEILAAGLMRLRARQSSHLSADGGESSLHFPPDESGRRSPEPNGQESA